MGDTLLEKTRQDVLGRLGPFDESDALQAKRQAVLDAVVKARPTRGLELLKVSAGGYEFTPFSEMSAGLRTSASAAMEFKAERDQKGGAMSPSDRYIQSLMDVGAKAIGFPKYGESLAEGKDIYVDVVRPNIVPAEIKKRIVETKGLSYKQAAEIVEGIYRPIAAELVAATNARKRGYADWTRTWLVRRWLPYIERIAEVPPFVTHENMLGVLARESKGIPTAVSSAGAAGLMQVMPKTGKEALLQHCTSLGVECSEVRSLSAEAFRELMRTNPELSIQVGAIVLADKTEKIRKLLQSGKYTPCALTLPMVLAAYNAGEGRVQQALDKAIAVNGDCTRFREYLPKETRDYISAVQQNITALSESPADAGPKSKQNGGIVAECEPFPRADMRGESIAALLTEHAATRSDVNALCDGARRLLRLLEERDWDEGGDQLDDAFTLQSGGVVQRITHADTTNWQKPYSTEAEAVVAEWALREVLLPAELIMFGLEVRNLWASYLDREPGDSLTPREFHQPWSELASLFSRSDVIMERQHELVRLIQQRLPNAGIKLAADGWTKVPVSALMNEAELNYPINFNDPFAASGNIAGDVGGSDAGPDYRKLFGSVHVYRKARADGSTEKAKLKTRFRFVVFDAIDFIPGDIGSELESYLTVPLSRLEASGHAYDVPFKVLFDGPPITVDLDPRVVDLAFAPGSSGHDGKRRAPPTAFSRPTVRR